MNKRYTVWVRKQIEVNTDPQRRCYYGCPANYEMRWTVWSTVCTYTDEATAKDSADCFKRINPTREYLVAPEGITPS